MFEFGISKKINLIFFLGIQTIAVSIGFYLYTHYVDSLRDGIQKTLLHGILVTDKVINKEEILNIDSDYAKTKKFYLQWKKIYEIRKIFGLRYLYILKPVDDKHFIFILDTGDHPYISLRKIDQKQEPFYLDFTPEEIRKIPLEKEFPEGFYETSEDNLFDIYEDAPQAAYKAFESESIQYEEYTDKYGNFKSAFFPMYYNGQKVGLYGADFEITYIRSLERKAQLNLMAAIIAGLLMTVLVRFIINKTIVSKILTLNENSKKIAQGNFDVHIDIKQKDELGELASTFNSMAQSLKESFLKIKEYNEQLEEKVKQRTKELSETLEKVQELKKQQDGDYFLTSLLLNPLMQNRTKSQKVSIQFFIDQKKKFTFRNKEHAIGGDVCISGDLLLKGKRHCMFFNGDAMGKSMQGAGGVLVVGSIVNSIMARSAANKRNLDMTAEEWLLETFYEMNRVMEAFDGSMFVSCIMGLINEETGRMVYFNAEHPFTILYRDKKASFLETTISAHKIGLRENKVELFHFKLKPGDVVLCGSDGKDDLVLSSENGFKAINENESLILSFVEKGNAELKSIYELLKSHGELSDDLSLVRIGYKENEVESQEFVDIEELNAKITKLIQNQNYLLALEKLEAYPYDNLYKSYYSALCLNKLNRNQEAITILENILNEFQNHLQTIRLLGMSYLKIGKKQEAKEYFLKYLKLKPDDYKIQDLFNKL